MPRSGHASIRRHKATRANSPPRCHLLALPREVRDIIWELLLVSKGELQPNVNYIFKHVEAIENSGGSFFDLQPERTLAIARTCKALEEETTAIYYGKNHFLFCYSWDLYAYLYMIGPERRACIRYISFMYQGPHSRMAFEQLEKCVGLKRLDVLLTWDTRKGARKPQNELFNAPGMQSFQAIKGLVRCELKIREVTDTSRYNYGWGIGRTDMMTYRELTPTARRQYRESNIKEVEAVLQEAINREATESKSESESESEQEEVSTGEKRKMKGA